MKPLPNGQGWLLDESDYFGERMFLKEALARFPELSDDRHIGISIHISMPALGRLVVSAVRAGEIDKAIGVVKFLEEVLAHPRLHPEIENAVQISFLEPEELTGFEAGRSFLDSMPESVRKLLS